MDYREIYNKDWDFMMEKECLECGKPMCDWEKGEYCCGACAEASMR